MFTGIVEEIGEVIGVTHQIHKSTLTIQATTCLTDVVVGDSIAVNGVCLTICTLTSNSFVFEAMPETVRITSLGSLLVGSSVNLERSITPTKRIGGHLVQGHVDGKTTIELIEQDGCSLKIWFKKLDVYADCFIPKGYVTIDGMSLTVVDVTKNCFSVCFIPHTQAVTIVKNYYASMYVNVEVDHITKTVAMMLKQREYVHGEHY